MNKELEVIRKLQHCGIEEYRVALEKVEKILLEYEQINNSKPNEALEVLDKTITPLLEPVLARYEDDLSDMITANYFALKQALLKAQENENGFGCSLEIVLKAVKQATFKGLYFDTVDTDGFERKGFIKCYLDYDGFTNRFFWNTGWNGNVWLSSHKKTWWLKENKEE